MRNLPTLLEMNLPDTARLIDVAINAGSVRAQSQRPVVLQHAKNCRIQFGIRYDIGQIYSTELRNEG